MPRKENALLKWSRQGVPGHHLDYYWIMKHPYLALVMLLQPLVGYTQDPVWSWGSVGTGDGYDNVVDVATDAAGNIFAVGFTESTELTFGTFTVPGPGSANAMAFVVKMDATGTPLWLRTIDGPRIERAGSVVVDADGNCIVAGAFSSSQLTIGDSTFTNFGWIPYFDAFLVKYDPEGEQIWARQMGGIVDDRVNDMTVDPDGSIYAVGKVASVVTSFGGTVMDPGLPGNIYYLKMDPDGNDVWVQMTGGADGVLDGDNALGVAWNADTLYLSGGIDGAEGNIGGVIFETAPMGSDAWVAKADPGTGIAFWAKRFGSPNAGEGAYLAVDALGNMHLAGTSVSSTFIVEGDTLSTNGLSEYVFVVQFDPAGEHTWTLATTGMNWERLYGIQALQEGGCAILGSFTSPTMNIGTLSLTNMNSASTYVVGIDAEGNTTWGTVSVGTTADQAVGITVDAFGDLYIGGFFTSVEFGLGDLQLVNTDAPSGQAFVAKLELAPFTGVDEPGVQSCRAFPNPVSQVVAFSGMNGGAVAAGLFDVAGRCVARFNLVPDRPVDVSGLAPGSYRMRLTDAPAVQAAFIKL